MPFDPGLVHASMLTLMYASTHAHTCIFFRMLPCGMGTFPTSSALLRGFAKKKKFQKSEFTMEVGGWVQGSLGFFFEFIPKIAVNHYDYFGVD